MFQLPLRRFIRTRKRLSRLVESDAMHHGKCNLRFLEADLQQVVPAAVLIPYVEATFVARMIFAFTRIATLHITACTSSSRNTIRRGKRTISCHVANDTAQRLMFIDFPVPQPNRKASGSSHRRRKCDPCLTLSHSLTAWSSPPRAPERQTHQASSRIPVPDVWR